MCARAWYVLEGGGRRQEGERVKCREVRGVQMCKGVSLHDTVMYPS